MKVINYQIMTPVRVPQEDAVLITGKRNCIDYINLKFGKNFASIRAALRHLVIHGHGLFLTLFCESGCEYCVLCGNDSNHFQVNKENDMDSIGIGLWFGHAGLLDYDGCYQLSPETIMVIRRLGFRVPKDFE